MPTYHQKKIYLSIYIYPLQMVHHLFYASPVDQSRQLTPCRLSHISKVQYFSIWLPLSKINLMLSSISEWTGLIKRLRKYNANILKASLYIFISSYMRHFELFCHVLFWFICGFIYFFFALFINSWVGFFVVVVCLFLQVSKRKIFTFILVL